MMIERNADAAVILVLLLVPPMRVRTGQVGEPIVAVAAAVDDQLSIDNGSARYQNGSVVNQVARPRIPQRRQPAFAQQTVFEQFRGAQIGVVVAAAEEYSYVVE